MTDIQKQLFAMQDLQYKQFHAKLMPTVDEEKVIGIRVPILRKFAKELSKTADWQNFINALPHEYYEENNLHAFLIEYIKDFDTALEKTEEFLPYIDNWATCDMFTPKVFKKYPDRLYEKILLWISSDKPYTVRYAIKLLMDLYLGDNFKTEYTDLAVAVRSEEYYVKMMVAWYFATALAKQYDAVIGYITEKKLDTWTHNKAIQKAIESRRIDDETKAFLRTLKIK